MSDIRFESSMDGKNYEAAIASIIPKGLATAGVMLEDDAILRAPVLSGRLRASITWATNRQQEKVRSEAKANDGVSQPSNAETLYVGTAVEYAPYKEYGTRFSKAKPFLRPSMKARRKDILNIFVKLIQGAIRGGK